MANFDPPDSHWCDNHDARLLGAFHYLKERLDALEKQFADTRDVAGEASAARDEAKQAVADCKFLLDEMRK